MTGRVLRVITRLNRGGPLRQLTALVPALAALGWRGPVFTGRCTRSETDGTDALVAAGADVRTLDGMGREPDPVADLRALVALVRAVRRERPDVLHSHTAKAGALARIAGRLTGVPTVHTFHGHHLRAPGAAGGLARRLERLLARSTAGAVALTPRQAGDLVERYRVLPRDRVTVVPPALDRAALLRAAAVPAQAATGRPRFLWAGRFVAVKQPLELVEAVASSSRAFELVMLGSGPLRRRVLARVRELGLRGVVRVPGTVPEVAPWLASSDLVVLTSSSEGAPLLVLEAQALGVGALVTTVGGIPDLVEHRESGWWVPPDDTRAWATALDRLAADPALLRQLGRGARAAGERLDPASAARLTAELYDSVRKGCPGPRR